MRVPITFDGVPFFATYTQKESVSAGYLRQVYNEGNYYWRATTFLPPDERPKFEAECVYQQEASEAVNQPPGTVSQIIVYHIAREFFVRVHQFILPDSQTDEWGRPLLGGASGLPDPKDIIEDDVWYNVLPEKVPKFVRRRRWEER